ncbi:MAG: 3-hydroxyacyl-CoA dehydrogenase NAD-binding domain-containing protein, partial [Bacteroidota bacterium]
MKNVAVIGAGTMGNGIAHVFAQKGYKVNLIDISQASLEKGLATISKNLDRQVAKEVLTEAQKSDTLANISTFTSTEEGVKGVHLVVEAATENVDLKLKIFTDLDKYAAPEVILASNTSSISITKIAAATSRADKVIGMHFMNP